MLSLGHVQLRHELRDQRFGVLPSDAGRRFRARRNSPGSGPHGLSRGQARAAGEGKLTSLIVEGEVQRRGMRDHNLTQALRMQNNRTAAPLRAKKYRQGAEISQIEESSSTVKTCVTGNLWTTNAL